MADSVDNRQKILDSALKLFAKKGYDAVSTMEIVNDAGITKPTMYYYFGSKEGLLEDILRCHYERFLKDLEKAASLPEDIPLTFFRIMRVYFDYALVNTDFMLLKLSTINRIGEDTAYLLSKPYIEKENALINGFFTTATSFAGNIKGKESLCTMTFVSIAHGAISTYLHSCDPTLLSDENIYRLRQQFLHGIYS